MSPWGASTVNMPRLHPPGLACRLQEASMLMGSPLFLHCAALQRGTHEGEALPICQDRSMFSRMPVAA